MSTLCEITLRVRYAETDQMNVAHHSSHIVWFEVGRIELLRQLGFSYLEMEQDGMNLPVVEIRCRYKHPARYDDEVTIRTRLAQLRGSLLRFQYELVRKSDGRLLAEGESVHVVVGRDMKKTRLSDKYRDALLAAAGEDSADRKSGCMDGDSWTTPLKPKEGLNGPPGVLITRRKKGKRWAHCT